jgi:hypothetical protein
VVVAVRLVSSPVLVLQQRIWRSLVAVVVHQSGELEMGASPQHPDKTQVHRRELTEVAVRLGGSLATVVSVAVAAGIKATVRRRMETVRRQLPTTPTGGSHISMEEMVQ